MTSIPISFFIFALVCTGALVALICWLLSRNYYQQITRTEQLKAETAQAILQEKLHEREDHFDELKTELGKARELADKLRQENKIETELRTKAEEKNIRLLIVEQQLAEKSDDITRLHGDNMALKERVADMENRLEEGKKVAAEKLAMLIDAREELSTSFKALSSDVLKSNSKSFFELAQSAFGEVQATAKKELELRRQSIAETVKPLQQSLQKVDEQIRQIEKDRSMAYAGLKEQVKNMAQTQAKLHSETANLVKALRTPNVRGRWGEIQLRRVVEMAGMVEYCDFIEQESTTTEHGRLRPDMVIKLPNEKNIVVDSKATLSAYLEALEAEDDKTKKLKMADHARQIRTHLTKLASKSYWEQFQPSPEFVVLFLPGENFFSAALEYDPELIEFGVNQRVILATPTTLIALLRAVSYGWRQEKITESAYAIADLGKQLHERLRVMANHFIDMRKGLDRTIESYNKAVGSFETRVMVSARKFQEIDTSVTNGIPVIETITKSPREIQGKEVINSSQIDQ